jgi:hypothetical protein
MTYGCKRNAVTEINPILRDATSRTSVKYLMPGSIKIIYTRNLSATVFSLLSFLINGHGVSIHCPHLNLAAYESIRKDELDPRLGKG